MKLYVISDTHFNHEKVITYAGRPFGSVEEMNEEIIRRWNDRVSDDDLVLHLGDVAFAPNKTVSEIASRLSGTKWLIMGNHDRRRTVTFWKRAGFERVFKHPLVVPDLNTVFSHEPIKAEGMHNIHGHLHELSLAAPNHTCVSVERTDYAPLPIGLPPGLDLFGILARAFELEECTVIDERRGHGCSRCDDGQGSFEAGYSG